MVDLLAIAERVGHRQLQAEMASHVIVGHTVTVIFIVTARRTVVPRCPEWIRYREPHVQVRFAPSTFQFECAAGLDDGVVVRPKARQRRIVISREIEFSHIILHCRNQNHRVVGDRHSASGAIKILSGHELELQFPVKERGRG